MMRSKIQLACACLLLSATVSAVNAAAGRMKGEVTDSAGNPLDDVVITATAVDFDYQKSTTSKKNGKFGLTVTDASRSYVIRMEKEGYQPLEEPFKFDPTTVMDVSWVMLSEGEASDRADQLQALEATDKATKAYNEGAQAYNAGDQDAAIGHFRAAVEANPEFVLAYAALARLYLEGEQWSDALAAAEAFLAIKPDDPIGLQMRYDSLWGAGDVERANQVLEQLIALDSGPAVAARIFNQAVAATKKQDYALAERGFSRALEVNPELYQALLPLAQIYFAGEKWQAAIDKAEAYLEHEPGNARANVVRFVSYEELGDPAAAKAAFDEIKSNSPEAAAELFLRDGTNFYNNGAIAEATKAVETSMALDPSNPQVHYQLGLCYASSGRNSEAKANLQKFLEMAPDHPEAASVRDMLSYLN